MKLIYWLAAAKGAESHSLASASIGSVFLTLICASKRYGINESSLGDQDCSYKKESWNSFIWDLQGDFPLMLNSFSMVSQKEFIQY